MTVAELIEALKNFPPEMEVIRTYQSDYEDVTTGQWELIAAYGVNVSHNTWLQDGGNVVEAVRKPEWLMRAHATMSAENMAGKKMYLCLGGN
jgi:hypothetical protein